MKSKSVKKLLGFMVLFSLMVQMQSQIVFADVSLSITPEQQQMSNWCWAATSVSVAKFYGKTTLVIGGNGGMPTTTVPTTQSNHVYKVAGSFTYNQPRSLSLVQSDFSSCYSLSSTYSSSNLDATTTNNQLYANKPVYVRIQWSGTTNGHFILIIGYLTANSLYQVMDPSTGSYSYHSFSSITSSYLSSGTWTHTLYNFQ